MPDKKKNSLSDAMSDLEKIFGKNIVGDFKNVSTITDTSYTTGSIGVDRLVKIPSGKITELYGPPSSGKTTLALYAAADCQRQGGNILFVDMEGSFDPEYAQSLGVDTEFPRFIYTSPDIGETAMEISEKLIRSGKVQMMIVDSVATLLPGKEADGEYGDATMGVHARLMGQVMRKMLPVVRKHDCASIWINQLREKIGGYGNPETTTGGNALPFYASLRLEVRKIGTIEKDSKGNVDHEPRRVKVIKSKINDSVNKFWIYDIRYGEGVDTIQEIIDLAPELGVLEKKGSWFWYGDTRLANGKKGFRQFLVDNPELYEEIKQKCLDAE